MGILRGSNPLADIEPSVEIDRQKAHFLCMKHLTLVILLALAPLSWGDRYHCSIDTQGGFNHEENEHVLDLFETEPDEDFRLVPRALALAKIDSQERDILAERYPVVTFPSGSTRNTHFFRRLIDDPARWQTWGACEVIKGGLSKKNDVFTCHGFALGGGALVFEFRVLTGKFTAAQIGTWHWQRSWPKDGLNHYDYYGSPSFFSYGNCEPFW